MTPETYRRRIAHLIAATEWSGANPYRQQVTERLESMGGQYAPPTTADRFTRRDDPRVDHLREVAEAKSEAACLF